MKTFVTNSFLVTAVQKLLKLILKIVKVIDRSIIARCYGRQCTQVIRTCSRADKSFVSTPYLHLSTLLSWRSCDDDDDDDDLDWLAPTVIRDIASTGSCRCRQVNDSASSRDAVVSCALVVVGLSLCELTGNCDVVVVAAAAAVDGADDKAP